jgi:hypothetical protein
VVRPNPGERRRVSVLGCRPTVSTECGGGVGAPRWEKSRRDKGFANGEKMIRCSALELLAGREKLGREGSAGGSCRRPRGATCGIAAEGDPVADTGRDEGRRCQAALVVVPCREKIGEVESGRVGHCGPGPI